MAETIRTPSAVAVLRAENERLRGLLDDCNQRAEARIQGQLEKIREQKAENERLRRRLESAETVIQAAQKVVDAWPLDRTLTPENGVGELGYRLDTYRKAAGVNPFTWKPGEPCPHAGTTSAKERRDEVCHNCDPGPCRYKAAGVESGAGTEGGSAGASGTGGEEAGGGPTVS